MNLPTVIIALAVAVLLGLAIRYLIKNGACAACGLSESCTSHTHRKGAAAASAGCGGKCSACQYYAYEQQLAAAAKAKRAAHPQG